MDLLTSIKGIGVTLAAALIVATGGFTYFDNAKQLTRYLGLSPIYQQFGTSVNVKGHINQNGGFKPQKPALCGGFLVTQV